MKRTICYLVITAIISSMPCLCESSQELKAVPSMVARARAECERHVAYDASYRRLQYPGGDVAADRGACTDLIIRSLRAEGVDLQALIHDDMVHSPASYGHTRATKCDTNIDHRRVRNHLIFMKRHAASLTRTATPEHAEEWAAGDLVYWKLTPGGLDHCGVISDRKGKRGLPLVMHNLGGAREEDVLDTWQITGHFRYSVTSKQGATR